MINICDGTVNKCTYISDNYLASNTHRHNINPTEQVFITITQHLPQIIYNYNAVYTISLFTILNNLFSYDRLADNGLLHFRYFSER